MATQRKSAEPRRPSPRLYLVAELAGDPAGLATGLAAALAAGDVAAVLLRLPRADERTLLTSIKALAPRVQEFGAALLLGDRPDLVARAGADGAHLTGLEAFEAAIPTLKPDRIAGCGGIHQSRHDAMVAAEAGADYVLFGEPDSAGLRPPFDAVLERVAWWAEVFEVPCVGFAATLDEIGPLSATGAEFIAVGDCIFADARGAAAAVRDAMARLAIVETIV
jgi:thiamine-phosphate pyrophosphorylase